MPRATKPKERFEIVLFNSKPTEGGHSYDLETLERIAGDINAGKGLALEEIDPIARQVEGISEIEVWKERIMADAVSCRLEDGVLWVTFEIRTTKYGKRFKAALDTHGIRGLYFFPVGYGTPDEKGVIRKYCLCYVSFEPRNAIKLPNS